MRILNLYAGIGGNRKLWSSEHDITAVEFDEGIAEIYLDLYPNDNVVVGDAHQYLLEHYTEYDFIWSSPPCQSHSVTNHFLNAQGVIRYPDMSLYQEILFLDTFFKGKYCVENVKSYYKPLIEPQISGRHYLWANFKVPKLKVEKQIGRMNGKNQRVKRLNNLDQLGIDLSKYNYTDKDQLLRNCVHPDIGKSILDYVNGVYKEDNAIQNSLFNN